MSIQLPYIFTLETEPAKELLFVKYAALDKITPTYFGPYIDGYPMKATLELGFTDLSPLYRSSFEEMEARITVTESGIEEEKKLTKLQQLAKDINKVRASVREANRIKGVVTSKAIGIPNTAKSYLDEISRGAL